jgi:hypothetical protein
MLSKTSKLGCYSWSLQAWDTCPGARGDDGEAVDACKFCYARRGNYLYSNVKRVRSVNLEDWKKDDWVDRMVSSIGTDLYFRWFDSGDCYHRDLAIKILEVMKRTPDTNHWFPTRMHKFNKFRDVLYLMSRLDNVVVRLSSDSVTGECIDFHKNGLDSYLNSSVIVPYAGFPTTHASVECDAYKREGKCGDCRACWSKDVKVISYPYHGVSKAKVIKLVKVA